MGAEMRWKSTPKNKPRKTNEKNDSLSLFLLFFALASSAQAQSGTTNVCGETDTTPGGSFTWSSTYSVPISVTPAPGTTWFLGQSQVIIPANGSVTVNVPATAMPGEYDLGVTFDTNTGGYPCGTPNPIGGKVIIQN